MLITFWKRSISFLIEARKHSKNWFLVIFLLHNDQLLYKKYYIILLININIYILNYLLNLIKYQNI